MKQKEINSKRTSRNPTTDIIRTIMYLKGKKPQEMAESIGVEYGTYQGRLRDGKFSLYEFITLCAFCDMNIVIHGSGINIDLKEYLRDEHKGIEVNTDEI